MIAALELTLKDLAMTELDKIVVAPFAAYSWERMPPHVKEDLLSVLVPLADLPVSSWPNGRVKLWKPEKSLYALPFWKGNNEIFVFFTPQPNGIQIESLLLQGQRVPRR